MGNTTRGSIKAGRYDLLASWKETAGTTWVTVEAGGEGVYHGCITVRSSNCPGAGMSRVACSLRYFHSSIGGQQMQELDTVIR